MSCPTVRSDLVIGQSDKSVKSDKSVCWPHLICLFLHDDFSVCSDEVNCRPFLATIETVSVTSDATLTAYIRFYVLLIFKR